MVIQPTLQLPGWQAEVVSAYRRVEIIDDSEVRIAFERLKKKQDYIKELEAEVARLILELRDRDSTTTRMRVVK